ncbi:hypothetical protein SPAN111604_01065 [Sphingomonas antarctica]|uniref:GDSL-type esterase/lipase family protein n=1 Tax=Sphingomonas antarctica TaxID=2040274 RepID=UPI0039EB6140
MSGFPRLRTLAVIAGLLLAYVIGMATGHYQLPPFKALFALKMRATGETPPKPSSSFHDALVAIDAALPPGQADVVMLGDSLTAYGRWDERFRDCRVINRGISGDTIASVRGRLGEVLSHRPTQVFVMAGVNDLVAGRPIAAIVSDYDTTVTHLIGGGATVVMQSALPCTGPETLCPAGRNAAIDALNRALLGLATRRGVAWLDLVPMFKVDGHLRPELTIDGAHLNAAGFAVWERQLAPLMCRPDRQPRPFS